ncbi:MAG: hypothetical protein K1060chlam2_00211 [Chlamydiae bacterium]|nr:hypothetical protein [Chlamydiota bacterium]
MDRFQELLWDLGELIKLPLHIDKNNACKLLLDEKLEMQIEMDAEGEQLLIAAFISEIPPGKFRENVLRDAMKVNSTYHPFGSFAYLEKTNFLILHQYIPTSNLSGEKLSDHLDLFVEESEEWRAALERGTPSPAKYHTHENKLL